MLNVSKTKLSMGLAACLFSACIASASFAQAGSPAPTAPTAGSPTSPQANVLTDSQIVGIVETANEGEIEAGKMAQKTSKTKSIKEFGKMMEKQHAQVNKDLKKLADRAKIKATDSELQTTLKGTTKEGLARLKGMKGADFDKAYAADQVSMHQSVLDTIDNNLMPNVKQQDLKTMLTNVRASVATHLDKAKALQSAVGSSM